MTPWAAAPMRFLASRRLALALLLLLIVVLAVSTLLPRKAVFPAHAGDLYHAWWFIALLVLIGVTLLPRIAGRKGSGATGWGARSAHMGVLVILCGAAVTAIFARRGELALQEGESRDSFTSPGGERKMGFAVKLDSFTREWHTGGGHLLTVLIPGEGVEKTLTVEPGRSYDVGASGYTLEIARSVPDFYLDEAMVARSRSDEPNNPALQVAIHKGDAREKRWIFSKFPEFDMAMSGDRNIRLGYAYRGDVRSYRSRVEVIEGGRTVVAASIEVNRPLRYKGYSFYQARYDPSRLDRTVLGVVRDPGVPLVYAGFVVLNLGVVLSVSGGFGNGRAEGEP